jgi:hypothetical protein
VAAQGGAAAVGKMRRRSEGGAGGTRAWGGEGGSGRQGGRCVRGFRERSRASPRFLRLGLLFLVSSRLGVVGAWGRPAGRG